MSKNKLKRSDEIMRYLVRTINRKKVVMISALCVDSIMHIYDKTKKYEFKLAEEIITATKNYATGKISLKKLKKYREIAEKLYDSTLFDSNYSTAYILEAIIATIDTADDDNADVGHTPLCVEKAISAYTFSATDGIWVSGLGQYRNLYINAAKKYQNEKMCNIIKNYLEEEKAHT